MRTRPSVEDETLLERPTSSTTDGHACLLAKAAHKYGAEIEERLSNLIGHERMDPFEVCCEEDSKRPADGRYA